MSIDERLTAAGLPTLPRGVWLEIDESALANNLQVVRELVGPGVEINAVVKADAYGHGLVPVARVFEAAGADRLCVASLDEALLLRGAGVQSPILVLFPIPAAEVARAAQARFEIVAAGESSTLASLAAWAAARMDGELKVHLEVETGLSRGGFRPADVARIARHVIETPHTTLAGLWSHLASPESESDTATQVELLEAATAAIQEAGLPVPARHMAATGGLFTGRAPLYDGVRPGLALYGLLPDDLPIGGTALEAAKRLRPAMSIRCRPLRVERLPAGTKVGYGGRWTAAREESIVATLPIGYGDGFVRAYSPGAEVLVRGVRAPLVGTVAMDAVMADVTDVPGVETGDEFVIIGEQNGARIVTNELARGRTTILWEVVTNMAYRVPRVYHADSVLLGLRTLDGEARINDVDLVHRGI